MAMLFYIEQCCVKLCCRVKHVELDARDQAFWARETLEERARRGRGPFAFERDLEVHACFCAKHSGRVPLRAGRDRRVAHSRARRRQIAIEGHRRSGWPTPDFPFPVNAEYALAVLSEVGSPPLDEGALGGEHIDRVVALLNAAARLRGYAFMLGPANALATAKIERLQGQVQQQQQQQRGSSASDMGDEESAARHSSTVSSQLKLEMYRSQSNRDVTAHLRRVAEESAARAAR
jgi:hypothetical protein